MADELPYGGYWKKVTAGAYTEQEGDRFGVWKWVGTTNPSDAAEEAAELGVDVSTLTNPMVTPDGQNHGYENTGYHGATWPDGTRNEGYQEPEPEPGPDIPAQGIALNPGEPRHITGDPRGSGGGDAPPPPLDRTAFKVGPGTLRDTEIAMATPIKHTIDIYMETKVKVDSEKGWVFAFDNPSVPGMTRAQGNGRNGSSQVPAYTDANPGYTEKMIYYMNTVLQATHDGIMLAATFMARLNDAAQTYALADKKSFVPPE